MIAYRLTGSRCRCASCCEHFNSVRAFDRHRVGRFGSGGEDRHCLTVAAMFARGWSVNSQGFWVMETRLDRLLRDKSCGLRAIGGVHASPMSQ
jgi:hypothetical protein